MYVLCLITLQLFPFLFVIVRKMVDVRFLLISVFILGVSADYPCVCNHGEPRWINWDMENLTNPIGQMNTSECKPSYTEDFVDNPDFFAIQHQHQVWSVSYHTLRIKDKQYVMHFSCNASTHLHTSCIIIYYNRHYDH